MVSYYYTKNDRAFVKRVLKKYEGRLEYDLEAKKGQRWRLDGKVITWQQLSLRLNQYCWKLDKKEPGRYYKAWMKVAKPATAPATLALIREELLKRKGLVR